MLDLIVIYDISTETPSLQKRKSTNFLSSALSSSTFTKNRWYQETNHHYITSFTLHNPIHKLQYISNSHIICGSFLVIKLMHNQFSWNSRLLVTLQDWTHSKSAVTRKCWPMLRSVGRRSSSAESTGSLLTQTCCCCCCCCCCSPPLPLLICCLSNEIFLMLFSSLGLRRNLSTNNCY